MWRRNATIAICLTVQSLATADADEKHKGLIAGTAWVRFQLVLGRIEVGNIRSSQTRTAELGKPDDEIYQKLLISADTEIPSLRYECQTSTSSLLIEVVNGNRVEILRKPKGNSDVPLLRFKQIPGCDLMLEVGSTSASQTYRAQSLWHMMIDSTEVVQTELAPILELMQPSWNFDDLLHRSQDELILQARASSFDTWRKARKLIAKLEHVDFVERQAAARQLREIGIGILPYLDRLDPLDLSREQRARLLQIRRGLSPKTPDSPERIAAWLAEDESVWISMLDHDELAIRKSAAAHLSKRFPRSLKFEPSAGASIRADQIARLKTRLLR